MKLRSKLTRTGIILALLLIETSPLASPQNFELVISHARLLTYSTESLPEIDAVAISNGKITEIGRSVDLEQRCIEGCKIIRAGQAFLMPGFQDAHAHQASGGAGFFRVHVSGSSVSSIVSTVKHYAESHPASAWIQGRGWDAAGFGTNFPSRRDLDRAESKRPIVLSDSDGHQLWTNSAAILAAGIDRSTRDPEGGTILRDANGEPSGIFLEAAADLIYAKVPEPTDEERRNYILKGQEVGLNAGITATHGGPIGLKMAQAYRGLEVEGKLHQRIFFWADLDADDTEFQKMLEFGRSLPKDGPNSGKVQLSAFKGFVDGVISSYTGALLEPYSDEPTQNGKPSYTQEKLNELVIRANRSGYPVALHSIGDRAVRMALNAYEFSKKTLKHSLINRIEHIEALDPADAPRFGQLQVAASMQPAHMHFGSPGSSYYPGRLGPERIKHAFAWNELDRNGALLLFGSDYPVVSQDPIEGMYCAIHRLYYSGAPFEPAQKVAPDTALRAYLENPLKAIGWGERLGKLQKGYEADLVLLREDPRKSEATSLSQNQPKLVIIQGKIVLNRLE